MKYTVRVTDGHCFRDIEVQTDKGVEEACSLAMDRATEIERSGDSAAGKRSRIVVKPSMWTVFRLGIIGSTYPLSIVSGQSASCCKRLRS
jgi:hypothetical protein